MKGGGHGSSLPDGYWIGALGGDDFYAFAEVGDFGGADEDHFERGVGVAVAGEYSFADGAVDLAAVGVADDAHVDGAEAGLRGVFYFGGEEDGSGTGTEGGLGVDELLQLCESFFSQQFQECARFAAGDDQAVDVIELVGLFDEHDFGAEFFEAAAVGVKIALQG